MINKALQNHLQSQANAYFEQTIQDLGISPKEAKDLGIFPYVVTKAINSTFTPLPAIGFSYKDFKGNPIDYTVNRFATPPIINGKPQKYDNPNGDMHYYLNGLLHYQAPINDTLFGTEGQKKSIVMNKYGVPTIGFTGVNGLFTKAIKDKNDLGKEITKGHRVLSYFVEFINSLPKKPKNLCFIYDTDFQDTRKHRSKNGRYGQFLSSVNTFVQACNEVGITPYLAYLTPKAGAKAFDDIKDHLVKNTVASDLRALQSSEFVNIINLTQTTRQEVDLLVGGQNSVHFELKTRYLSDDYTLKLQINREIADHNRISMHGGTGVGKTTFSLELVSELLEQGKKVYFVLPTNSLIDSTAKSIDVEKAVVNQYLTPAIRKFLGSYLGSHRLVFTTYHSFGKVAKNIEEDDVVFFDEFHKAILQMEGLNNFDKHYKELLATVNPKTFHITATPLNDFYSIYGMRVIKIYTTTPRPQLHGFVTKNIRLAAKDYVGSLVDKNKGINVLFMQNSAELAEIGTLYSEHFEVQLWHSCDTVRNSGYYKHFLEKNEFLREQPDKPLLVLATSFIGEGVSFLNKDIATVSTFGVSEPQNIIQSLKRTRNFDSNTKFTVVVGANTNKKRYTPLFHVMRVLDQQSIFNNATTTEKGNKLKEILDSLTSAGSFTHLIDDKGLFCPFRVAKELNRAGLIKSLQAEFELENFAPYQFQNECKLPPADTDKENKEEIDKKALEILTETPQKAVNLVYSNTNNPRLKKWLKTKHNAKFEANLKELVLEFYELEKYYLLLYKLHKYSLVGKCTKTLWAYRGEYQREKLMELVKVAMVGLLIDKNTIGNEVLSVVAKLEYQQISFVYQYLRNFEAGGVFNGIGNLKKDIYGAFIENMNTGVSMKELNRVGLATKKECIDTIVTAFIGKFDSDNKGVKLVSRSESGRSYAFDIREPMEVLRIFSLEVG
jgi:hypothetical protein